MKIEEWFQYRALSLLVLVAAGYSLAMLFTAPSTAGAQTKKTEPFTLSTPVDAPKKSVGVLPDSEIAAAIQRRGVDLIVPDGRTRGFEVLREAAGEFLVVAAVADEGRKNFGGAR